MTDRQAEERPIVVWEGGGRPEEAVVRELPLGGDGEAGALRIVSTGFGRPPTASGPVAAVRRASTAGIRCAA